jgi:uncharacterized membrane protein
MQHNQPKLDLPITQTAKTLEIAGFLLLLSLWITAFVLYVSSPDIIPVHFNLAGAADRYGSKTSLFLTAGIGTFLYLLLTVINRYPHAFNYLVTINAQNATEQYRKATTMLRVLKMGLLVLLLVIELTSALSANHKPGLLPFILIEILPVVVLPVAIVLYMTAQKKTAKQG